MSTQFTRFLRLQLDRICNRRYKTKLRIARSMYERTCTIVHVSCCLAVVDLRSSVESRVLLERRKNNRQLDTILRACRRPTRHSIRQPNDAACSLAEEKTISFELLASDLRSLRRKQVLSAARISAPGCIMAAGGRRRCLGTGPRRSSAHH